MILEQHPLPGQPVEVWRLNVRVAHATQGIPSLVVSENKQEVGLARRNRSFAGAKHQRRQQKRGKKGCLNRFQ